MNQLRVVPEIIHGALQYLLGIFLIVAPFIFSFAEDSTATVTSIALGVVALLLALTTIGPASAADVFSAVIGEVYSFALGIFLIVFPFIFDRAGDETRDTVAYVFVGLAWFVITLATGFPRKQRAAVETAAAEQNIGTTDADSTAGTGTAAGDDDAHPPTSSQTPGMEP